MSVISVARQRGRSFAAVAAVVATVSLALPQPAHAKHGNGAAIALGILGGALAGAAIASTAAPGYYAAPPAYYYPYAPQVYATPPAYYYTPPATYYGPPAYYGSGYYYGGY
jgi:hypothetical protein